MRAHPPAFGNHAPPGPPPLPFTGPEAPIDQALALALSNELYAGLRVAAAIVRRDLSMPSALCLLGRLLGELGHRAAAVDACTVAVARSIDLENLPLAVVSAQEMARFGGDFDAQLDLVAASFCRGSPRLGQGSPPPPPCRSTASSSPSPRT